MNRICISIHLVHLPNEAMMQGASFEIIITE